MKQILLIFSFFLYGTISAVAQQPLYIVNGEVHTRIDSIPPSEIEHIETLPADEQTIARYGTRASGGVILITLCYDQRAEFPDGSFADYIGSRVDWPQSEPAARVVVRYTISPEGRTVVDKVLESTDSRLRRRVLKAIEEAPAWRPAMKCGNSVPSQDVLHIRLPEGKPMPPTHDLVWR